MAPSPSIDELTIADPPQAWRDAGFDVEDDAFEIGNGVSRCAYIESPRRFRGSSNT